MATIDTLERPAAVQRGRRLEYFTVVWNTVEGLVAFVAGMIAGSISLVGFGIDSFIEVTSGSVLLWRMSVDSDVHRRKQNEKRALRIVEVCFLLLAAYIAYDSIVELWSKRAPEHSIAGIILACVSLVVMPILPRAKRKVGGLWAAPLCRRMQNRLSFARIYRPSCWAGCCSTPSSGCGGPILWRRSSWFPSSQKKESKECRVKPATIVAVGLLRMSPILTVVAASVTTFAATNVDDIFLLTLFFARRVPTRRIVAGQYLGFAAIVAVTLAAVWTVGLAVPRAWVRPLGILPIAIGMKELLQTHKGRRVPKADGSTTRTRPGPTDSHMVRRTQSS
jgi:hypothetical protein